MKENNYDTITKLFNEFESIEYKGEVLFKENYSYSGFDTSKRHMYIVKVKNVEDVLVVLYSRAVYSNPFSKNGGTSIRFIGFGSIGHMLITNPDEEYEVHPVSVKYIINEESWRESKNTELYMEGMIKIVNKNDIFGFLLDTEFAGGSNV